MSNVLLVDGDNLLTIGFFGLKNHFYKGEHIGGIYHFINTLRRTIEIHHLDKIVVFWDGQDGSIREKGSTINTKRIENLVSGLKKNYILTENKETELNNILKNYLLDKVNMNIVKQMITSRTIHRIHQTKIK